MVTRAEIVSVLSDEKVKVKIYAYDNVEEDANEDDLSNVQIARVCSSPGVIPDFKNGDIVFVCIEDNNLEAPIVMGKFLVDKCKEDNVGKSRAYLNALKVTDKTTLGSNTSIGEVESSHIKCLKGAKSNIQNQIDKNIEQQCKLLDSATDIFNKFVGDIS